MSDPGSGAERVPSTAAPSTTRRGLHPYVAQAPEPKVGGKCTYHATDTRLRFVAKRGVGALQEANETLREVLLNPKFVFQGVRQDDDEAPDGDGWLCYIGRPKTRIDHATGSRRGTTADRAFLVFVTKEGILYNWRWEEADPVTCKPTNCHGRFRKQVFP